MRHLPRHTSPPPYRHSERVEKSLSDKHPHLPISPAVIPSRRETSLRLFPPGRFAANSVPTATLRPGTGRSKRRPYDDSG